MCGARVFEEDSEAVASENGDRLAGDVLGGAIGEADHDAGDLAGAVEAPERHFLEPTLGVLPQVLVVDDVGRDGVRRDAVIDRTARAARESRVRGG